MPLEPGASFGRYRIEALLGKGGMGEVFRAVDTLLHRSVAIKILRSATSENATEAATDNILREARDVAAIQHPNIVSLFDFGEHDGVFFITMELVEGQSLRSFIGQPDVPLEQRVRWLADIGRALDAAHRAGIVHRDVKPENIMINDAGMVKVLDFGIGQRMAVGNAGDVPTSSLESQRGGLAGTPHYMAPEQVRRKDMDGRTDQFAWGVVAYELCTGKMPWNAGLDRFDVFYSIVQDTPKPPRELNPDIAESLDQVIRRALEKEPVDRFASMNDAVLALEQSMSIVRGTPVRLAEPRVSADPAVTMQDQTVEAGNTATDSAHRPVESVTGAELLAPSISTTSATTYDKPLSAATRESTNGTIVGRRDSHRFAQRIGLFSVVVLGLIGAVFVGTRQAPTSSMPDDAASSIASAMTSPVVSPTTLLDLPPPKGCNAEAVALVQSGIVAQHDGDWPNAHARYEKATKADAECALAFVRLALMSYYQYSTAQIHEVYQRALELRGFLGERDRALLDALEPLLRRDPSDREEFTTRLLALAKRFPGDAELAFLSADFDTDYDRRLASGRNALRLDPHYSDAYQRVATTLARKGDWQGALDTLNECVRSAPNSIDCVLERTNMAGKMGRCAEAETYARKGITMAPKSAEAYAMLASAMAAEGRPVSTIEEALRQRWARLPEADASHKKALEQARLDALVGRFDRAESAVRELRRRVQAEPSFEVQAAPALLLVNLLVETGRVQEAATLAEDFLGRRSVWSAKLYPSSADVKTFHLEPLLLDVERKANRITDATWKTARAEWIAGTISARRFSEPTQWALGTAMPVESASEAAKALASMPTSVLSMDKNLVSDVISAPLFIGKMLLLAGQIDDSARILQYATAHCDAFDIPFEDTYASMWLGQALEKKNDVTRACAAYAVVMRRWGKAKPPSRSAQFAEKRRSSLACTP